MGLDELGQALVNLALLLAGGQLAVLEDGDTGGVVAAIFEATKPLDEDGGGLLFPDVADDAAHSW